MENCGNCVSFWVVDRVKKIGYCINPDSTLTYIVINSRMPACSEWEGK